MVKIIRKVAFVDHLKDVYDKSFWHKLKYLWSTFQKSNPSVAMYAPITTVTCIPLFLVVLYKRIHANPVAKYYDHINIYRPDDPNAALIRKDDSLKYRMSTMYDTIHMPGTI